MHVDQFIDGGWGANQYTRWFFMLHRFPAAHQNDFADFIAPYKLFCTFEGQRYRVTGCSRMGDIWLARDFNRTTGYDRRVDLEKCSDFSPEPEFLPKCHPQEKT